MGTLLATSSVNDTDVIIWNVDTNTHIPLKRIGLPAALVYWSPNSQRLFASTIGNVFRVWHTENWTPERWTVPNGSIQSAAWSPCSNHLIFVTTADPILYRLCFVDDQLYQSKFPARSSCSYDSNKCSPALVPASMAPKQSFPIVDLSQSGYDKGVGGLAQSVCWDPSGKYVAVMFKNAPSVAVFSTSINRNMVHISPSVNVIGDRMENESASFICFKNKYKSHSHTILTIGWSSGRVQYFPMS